MSLRDIAADVDRWREAGDEVALATVVRTWGSGPRGAGAKMATDGSSKISGSVSGGCVESAVVEDAREVLASGKPKLVEFGVSDETAWEVGLSCGGSIQIFVEPLTESLYEELWEPYRDERARARAVVISGDEIGRSVVSGPAPPADVTDALVEAAADGLRRGRSSVVPLEGGHEAFVDVELPPPSLVMVGGVHVAIALASLATSLGYRPIVVDPRSTFGSAERFPHVSRIIREWPDDALREIGLNRSTAVATLTHDPKLDDPALEVALPSPAFYVGALGSRRTHEKRRARLIERGLDESELDRLHAPIGLAIGSRTPEEIALSIMAQIVATKNGVSA